MLAESVAQKPFAGATPADRGASMAGRREAAKQHLNRIGLNLATFADRHGYARKTVYKVMAGDLQCHFGISHNIAVRLGLKDGEIDPANEPVRPLQAAHG